MTLYINRYTRVRHADPACSALRRSFEMAGSLDGVQPPLRIAQLPEPADADEAEAIRQFTHPCTICVEGARESWDALPIVFESRHELDPYMDWTDLAIVVRNEPTDAGEFRVIGRLRNGDEVVIDSGGPLPIGEIVEV
jgi:hypothetical protein